MRPIRLEMEGFGAFRAATVVDFSDIELVALVGRTGSGKSTVIDALTFALYGSVARYDDNRAVAPVINQLATRARVRLDFELGGRRYTAVRLVQRQGTGATTKEARLESGDEVLAADPRGMSAAVAELLGLDASQFNRTIVLPQGRFADFLHDEPGKRQETLRGLLGFGIYRHVATAARRRATERAALVEALRAEADADAADLTDARRSGLVERRDALVAARSEIATALADLEGKRSERAAIERELADLDRQLVLLEGIQPPDDLDSLERVLDETAMVLTATTAAVADARSDRRAADAAAAEGPDIAGVTRDLAVRRDAQQAADEHAHTVAASGVAEAQLTAARDRAAVVQRCQQRLDHAAAAARAAERAARRAVDLGPSPTQVEHWISQRRRHDEGLREITALQARLGTATNAVGPLRAARDAALAHELAAHRRRDDLQQRAGAAGFIHLLEGGKPCPLCLQDVHAVPMHHVDDDLAEASADLDRAVAAAAGARDELDAAERDKQVLDARLAAERRAFGALQTELTGVADEARLIEQQAEATRVRAELAAATTSATAADDAAAAHRAHPDTAAVIEALAGAEATASGLRALEATQRARRESTSSAAAALPLTAELEAALAAAAELARRRDAAGSALAVAEEAQTGAMAAQAAAEHDQRAAVEALGTARDLVAALGPPPVGGDRIGASWARLVAWADAARVRLASSRASGARRRTGAAEAIAAVERAVRATADAALGPSRRSLPDLRDAVLSAEATSAADLAAFDRARSRHTALHARIDQLAAERAVADQLGHLLRADGFEAWLMEAALGELVDDAAERLRELSSGQFSLQLVGRELMVRDHANADELRGVRTLSGGETFLASLSLALALAEATSDLAADGAPALESIFLDEGFGTLDPSTLDVVASAIEELGSAGRMVAVVTHIRELAERMPVRLEVTKVGASATVERVDA